MKLKKAIRTVIVPVLLSLSVSVINCGCNVFGGYERQKGYENSAPQKIMTHKKTAVLQREQLMTKIEKYLSSSDSTERKIVLGYLANFNPFGDSLKRIIGEDAFQQINPIIENNKRYQKEFIGTEEISDTIRLAQLDMFMTHYKINTKEISELYSLYDFSGRD